jgi:single-stranded DNA-binding protein
MRSEPAKEGAQMSNATGTFEVTSGSEDPYHEVEGGVKLTRAIGTQRFVGEIQGEGAVDWLMCYLPDKTATFVGLQRVEGSVGGRSGSFVMESVGVHDGKRSTATWSIVAGSGTGELAGINGRGSFDAPSGPSATYELEYRLG